MAPRHNETFIPQVATQETATNHSRSPVSQGCQEQISVFPFAQNQLHQRWRLPSIAYFMSRANRFHMISALILPTFSSCGNLVEWKGIPVRITSPRHHALHRVAWCPELQQTTDVQEGMLAESHYPIIPPLPSIIPKTGWIRAGGGGWRWEKWMDPGGNGTAERRLSVKAADYLPDNLLCI